MQQRKISRKSEIRDFLNRVSHQEYTLFAQSLNDDILVHRVKFPLLEFIADELFRDWQWEDLVRLCDDVADFNHISSWPLIGKILQNNLTNDLDSSFRLAVHYIIKGNEWHVCDCISERVFGNGLLLNFPPSFDRLNELIIHPNSWIKRVSGIAVHLAAKRGLSSDEAKMLIELLLLQKNNTNTQVQKGCGWGIETIAKFHPDLAQSYEKQIFDGQTKAWIIKKYKLGLAKSKRF